ncbi:unnamed protein product [Dibothriocephalus latus]|uniref:EF-hand domain-containing protein n=1 Tax=Dibothriocephalus latus TaxID=60516 RepID=A0A3P6U521_DIBLA|nr:unnamed protein product [Dibothriocephalus latus]
MSDYMQIYTAVDKDNKGYITIPDLEKYAKENGMNPKIAQKWQIEFDPQNTGRIKLEKFCEVLNVDPKEVAKQQEQQHAAVPSGKIRVLDQEMSERMMEDTLNITKQYISEYPSDLKGVLMDVLSKLLTARLLRIKDREGGELEQSDWFYVLSI